MAPLLGDLVLPAAAPVLGARAMLRAFAPSSGRPPEPPRRMTVSADASGMRPTDVGRRPVAAALMAVAIPAGLLLALVRVGVRPALPLGASSSGWEWLFWLAPVGAVLGVVAARARVPTLALAALALAM